MREREQNQSSLQNFKSGIMVTVFIEVGKLGDVYVCKCDTGCGKIIIVCFGHIEFEVLPRH